MTPLNLTAKIKLPHPMRNCLRALGVLRRWDTLMGWGRGESEIVMDEVIEVENYIDDQFVRHVHLMSNSQNIEANLPAGVTPTVTKEAGVYHLRASWAAREAFAGTMRGEDRREHQVVLWALNGERVRKCIRDAAAEFVRVFSRRPSFATMKSYPESMGFDVDVEINGGTVALIECADVPAGFVMVF